MSIYMWSRGVRISRRGNELKNLVLVLSTVSEASLDASVSGMRWREAGPEAGEGPDMRVGSRSTRRLLGLVGRGGELADDLNR